MSKKSWGRSMIDPETGKRVWKPEFQPYGVCPCGEIFPQPYGSSPQTYHSRECAHEYSASRGRSKAICARPGCGIEFTHRNSEKKLYHSQECYYLHKSESSKSVATCECGREYEYYTKYPQRTCGDQKCKSSNEENKKSWSEGQNRRHENDPVVELPTSICPICGEEFTQDTKEEKWWNKTCADPLCVNVQKGLTRRGIKSVEEAEIFYYNCFYCNKKIPSLTPLPPHCRIFHSSECFMEYYRETYGKEYEVRTSEEKKNDGAMKSAFCEYDGREFMRPIHSDSKMMFCSIPCSNAMPSYTRLKRYDFRGFSTEGHYELRFLGALARLDIYFEEWDKQQYHEYFSERDQKIHQYRPDFVVGDLTIEVKGQIETYQQEAHKSFRETGKLVIVDQALLEQIERIFDKQECLRLLEQSSRKGEE